VHWPFTCDTSIDAHWRQLEYLHAQQSTKILKIAKKWNTFPTHRLVSLVSEPTESKEPAISRMHDKINNNKKINKSYDSLGFWTRVITVRSNRSNHKSITFNVLAIYRYAYLKHESKQADKKNTWHGKKCEKNEAKRTNIKKYI
jgi:hypothetical protein